MWKLWISLWITFMTFNAVDDNGGGTSDDGGDESSNKSDVDGGNDGADGGDNLLDDGAKEEGPATMADALKQGLKDSADAAAGITPEPKKDESNPKEKLDKDGKPAAELDKDGKPVEKPADKPKALTDEDLKTPDGLSAKAGERFQQLANTVRESQTQIVQLTEERDAAHQANMEFVSTMDRVGAGPDELNAFVTYMDSFNKGDYKTAQTILNSQQAELSRAMGTELPGVDLLDKYPDLKEEVDNFEITRTRAVEIAIQRDRDGQRQQQQDQTHQNQQQQNDHTALVNKTIGDIDSTMAQFKKVDVDFDAKQAIMLKKDAAGDSMVDDIIKNNHPSQWIPQLKIAYKAIQIHKDTGNTQNRHTNSLRPSGKGGGEPAPGSMLEALTQGLKKD